MVSLTYSFTSFTTYLKPAAVSFIYYFTFGRSITGANGTSRSPNAAISSNAYTLSYLYYYMFYRKALNTFYPSLFLDYYSLNLSALVT